MYGINDIKTIRKRAGITQQELAVKSGVSQSLIAKIEAGKIDPTFSKARRILDCLESINQKKGITAERLMQKRIISMRLSDDIKKTIAKMKKHGISQLPVLEKGKVVGMVSETAILDAVIKGKQDLKVNDVLEDTPPSISKKSPLSMISSLLKFYPMVIVSEKGKQVGIITKADVIGAY